MVINIKVLKYVTIKKTFKTLVSIQNGLVLVILDPIWIVGFSLRTTALQAYFTPKRHPEINNSHLIGYFNIREFWVGGPKLPEKVHIGLKHPFST